MHKDVYISIYTYTYIYICIHVYACPHIPSMVLVGSHLLSCKLHSSNTDLAHKEKEDGNIAAASVKKHPLDRCCLVCIPILFWIEFSCL